PIAVGGGEGVARRRQRLGKWLAPQALRSAKRGRVAERRGYIFSTKVACHPRKNGFGKRVKMRGSTSERERSRAGCPCHLADNRNAQPLFTDVDPGADVQRNTGELCFWDGNSSAGAR